MAFSINKFLNEESKKEIKSDWKPIRISVHKLRPAAGKENFYHIDDKEVEETARTIELVGIQQYPVVKPLEGADEYEVIAGHKRRLAVLKLVEEGKTDYEMIPCKVEQATDSIRNELILIFTNSTQRSRTDYEKMQEIKRVKELLTEYQKNNELTGRKQNIIAEILGTNKTKVGTLENIDRNLIEQFKEEFAAGRISTNAANEIAGLDKEAQIALFETYKETGSLTAKDAKAVKVENEQAEGQMDIIDFPDCLPEDLQEEAAEKKQEQQEQQEQPKPKEQTEEVKVTFNQPTPVSNYLTENEIYVLQDIMMKCRERAGR
jgi:ParB family chromosome partitioning protein